MQENETETETALREIAEEVGLSVRFISGFRTVCYCFVYLLIEEIRLYKLFP
jgi:ADP-ribose pyrophosphatase YjhB (NUDIX family)